MSICSPRSTSHVAEMPDPLYVFCTSLRATVWMSALTIVPCTPKPVPTVNRTGPLVANRSTGTASQWVTFVLLSSAALLSV